MNVPDWVGRGLAWSVRRERNRRGGSLTSIEDPQRDELDLDDGGDNTHPASMRERKNQHPDIKQAE